MNKLDSLKTQHRDLFLASIKRDLDQWTEVDDDGISYNSPCYGELVYQLYPPKRVLYLVNWSSPSKEYKPILKYKRKWWLFSVVIDKEVNACIKKIKQNLKLREELEKNSKDIEFLENFVAEIRKQKLQKLDEEVDEN